MECSRTHDHDDVDLVYYASSGTREFEISVGSRLGCSSRHWEKVTHGRFRLRVIGPDRGSASTPNRLCLHCYIRRKEEHEDGLSEKIAVETLTRGVGVLGSLRHTQHLYSKVLHHEGTS